MSIEYKINGMYVKLMVRDLNLVADTLSELIMSKVDMIQVKSI